ncbi:MAG: adenylate/guanylate cyclase domain-containing protein [Geminicoccaceae bacterium]
MAAPSETGPRPPFRFVVGLRTTILCLFLAIFLAFLAFLIWFQYREGRELTLTAAERLMDETGGRIEERMGGLLAPVYSVVDMSARLPLVTARARRDDPDTLGYALSALDRHPQIASLFVAFADGGVRQWLAIQADDLALRGQLGAPPGTAYAVRTVDVDGAERRERWQFLGATRQVLGERPPQATSFDARRRPWYRAAERAGTTTATEVYVFAATHRLGTTIVTPFTLPEPGVVGADIALTDVDRFLGEHRIGEGSRLALFTDNGRVAAASDGTVRGREDRTGQLRLPPPSGVGDPVIAALGEAFADGPGLDDGTRTFAVDGAPFVGRVMPLTALQAIGDTSLGIAVPLDTLVGPLTRIRDISLLGALVLGAIAVGILALAARAVSQPLVTLAGEARRISDLELGGGRVVWSRIIEVQRLADTIEATKSALQTFGLYVPRTLVRQLMHSGKVAELGGERRDVTVMFSDIVGFTTMVERVPPGELVTMLFGYFEALGSCVQRHGGTIDKFIGDALMAFWNAPLEHDDHAAEACRTVLACEAVLAELNARRVAEGHPAIATRFGLHTGEALVGNMGSTERMNYTAVGATVNLASRLEGLNKQYGTTILVSEALRQAAPGFAFRTVDLVRAAGTQQPTLVHELLGARDALPPATLAWCERWNRAAGLYLARAWEEAEAAFAELEGERPQDPLTALYRRRLAQLRQQPPGPGWDGVFVATEK